MRRIRVHIDIPNKEVVVKRGFFGSTVRYSGGWWDDYSIAEIIKHFEEEEDGRRELSVLSLTPLRISESDGTKKSLEVMTVTGRALMDTDGLLLPVILSALMTMMSLMLTQQSLTSSLNLSQGRPSHDGFGFYKSALFAGLSGR